MEFSLVDRKLSAKFFENGHWLNATHIGVFARRSRGSGFAAVAAPGDIPIELGIEENEFAIEF